MSAKGVRKFKSLGLHENIVTKERRTIYSRQKKYVCEIYYLFENRQVDTTLKEWEKIR